VSTPDQSERLSKLILFGEASPRRAVTEFIEHDHLEPPAPRQTTDTTATLPS
jgi:hypothetical protein